jgi:hypothetical protein
MHHPLTTLLRPVLRRQRWQQVFAAASLGLLLASIACLVLGLVGRLAGYILLPTWSMVLLLVVGPVAGAALAWLRRTDWQAAARAVDQTCDLKDCTVSALDFADRTEVTTFHELTQRDAIRYVEAVEPRRAAPLCVPGTAPWAIAALVLALLVLPQSAPPPAPAAAPSEPPQAVVDEADKIEKYAAELAKLAEAEQHPGLKKLAEEMKKSAEQLRQPGVDTRAAMARISELQKMLAGIKAELNTQLVEGQLKDLGGALREAPRTEQAGKALQDARLAQAAQLLEDLAKDKGDSKDPQKAKSDPGNRAAGEKVERVAKQISGKKLERLSQAAEKIAEGLKGDDQKMQQGARDLADEVRQQERRQRINELLAREDRRLQDCKSNCEKNNILSHNQKPGAPKSSSTPQVASARPQPDRAGGKDGNASGQRDKSSSRHKDGSQPQRGKPGNDRKDAAGSANPGPAETEAGDAPGDARAGTARRSLPPEVYRRSRQLAEAMIDNEAIPLGYRETIRKYFELLRPSAMQDDSPAPAGPPK